MPAKRGAVRRRRRVRTGLRARPRKAKNFVKIQFPAMYVKVPKQARRRRRK